MKATMRRDRPSMLSGLVVLAVVATATAAAAAFVIQPTARSTSLLQANTANTTAPSATSASDDVYRILFQGADPAVPAPLPPAFTDCPFTGILAGPGSFYRRASTKLRAPSLFSFVHKDRPMVEVSGGKTVQRVFSQEFTALESNSIAGISQTVCGTQSVRTVADPEEHRALRRLIGAPLGTKTVAQSVPLLERLVRTRMEPLLRSNSSFVALELTQAFALDVVWQQILGLSLETPQEIDAFREQTSIWLRGMYNKRDSPEFLATLKAKDYLVQVMETKIDQLLQAGQSDGSTLGGLVYATTLLRDTANHDEGDASRDDPERALTRQQVIDNALLLILAGTEVTSSTLANSLLLLGLHPPVWQKVVDEQRQIVEENGETLTPALVFPEQGQACYLDAVIQETMRIMPVTLVSRRVTTNTILVDGMQIPKGIGVSYNIYLTHQRDDKVEHDGMDLMTGFRPERWLDPATRPVKPDYIPFGSGPRYCPGALLALTEQKTFLSLFARAVPKYQLEMVVDPSIPIDYQINCKEMSAVATPQDGVPIRIIRE